MLNPLSPSKYLYRPQSGKLFQMVKSSPPSYCPEKVQKTADDIRTLVSNSDSFLRAFKAYLKDDYQVGFYKRLGSGESWRDLRNDLIYFIHHQQDTSSTFHTFWAIFEEQDLTEEEFERALWGELSVLTSVDSNHKSAPHHYVARSTDPELCFQLEGQNFFVVGLHPKNSSPQRKFPVPALIFNIYNPLEIFGQYESMATLNRSRFQMDLRLNSTLYNQKKYRRIATECPYHYYGQDERL